jgi:hypothetical protein
LIIQPIVEGYGELNAVPVLLRRLQAKLGVYTFQIARPIRRRRSELATEEQVRRSVRLALGTPQCGGILILFDSDDACPKEFGPTVQAWAQAEAGAVPCAVVLAHHEYEAWFRAAIESLRGFRRVRPDAVSHPTPEGVRNCKGAFEERLEVGASYSPRVDQAAFSSQIDFRQAHLSCRSFRRLTKAFGQLAEATGAALPAWPPAAWL